MQTMTFTGEEVSMLMTALDTARTQFRLYAARCGESSFEGIATQFKLQEAQTQNLLMRVVNGV